MRVKLEGGPPRTSSTVEILENGDVFVEFYDHSDTAERFFGNDVATMATVASVHKPELRRRLGLSEGVSDRALLDALALRFESAWAIVRWLEEGRVPFTKTFDSWA